jgi:hypothetical protein
MKLAVCVVTFLYLADNTFAYPVSLGPRPYWLVDQMRDIPLKEKLGKSNLIVKICGKGFRQNINASSVVDCSVHT